MFKERNNITCFKCKDALCSSNEDLLHPELQRLILAKGEGKLQIPSKSVYLVVKKAEEFFRIVVGFRKVPQSDPNIVNQIAIRVMRELNASTLFPTLWGTHLFEQNITTEELHPTQLIKTVVKRFLQMRTKSFSKFFNDSLVDVDSMSSKNFKTKLSHYSNE